MARPKQLPVSQSSNLADITGHRLPASTSSISLALPTSATLHNLATHGARGTHVHSSRTWTTSSGELGLLSDTDEVEDRATFVQEYNRLAKKHGLRLLIAEDFADKKPGPVCEKRGWFYRVFRSSTNHPPHVPPTEPKPPPPENKQHKRSVSDLAYLIHSRREPPKIIEIQAMVRLSGKSILYLPPEYTPCSLILPTCIRATAQFLAQNATTRGIFRIPGSVRIVNTLFEYYCYVEGGSINIAGTVRCTTLPIHIKYSVHDIASTFKRLLSVLPGGILGSLALFDAFVAIHSQMHGEPEYPRTKQTKIRARLLALAIGTIKSQFRRELICAVFGLLSLIGRIAEITPREDENGRPLPTTDLMGYTALGIVFGPLLVGDLLDQYTMKLATPDSGMVLFPLSPKQRRKDRRKAKAAEAKVKAAEVKATGASQGPPTIDKILVANSIAEMVISNWRDVVRQMRALGTYHRRETSSIRRQSTVRPSRSGSLVLKLPPTLEQMKIMRTANLSSDREHSPEPDASMSNLKMRKSRAGRSEGSHGLNPRASVITLAPTAGNKSESVSLNNTQEQNNTDDIPQVAPGKGDEVIGIPGKESAVPERRQSSQDLKKERTPSRRREESLSTESADERGALPDRGSDPIQDMPQVYLESVPPRVSSKQAYYHDSSGTFMSSSGEDINQIRPEQRNKSFEMPNTRKSERFGAEYPDGTPRGPRTPLSTRPSRQKLTPHTTPTAEDKHRSQTTPTNYPPSRRSASAKRRHRSQPSTFLESGMSEHLCLKSERRARERQDEAKMKRKPFADGCPSAGRDTLRDSGEFFYTPQNESSRVRVASDTEDPFPRSSIDTTPKRFYSPMRVPEAVAQQAGENEPRQSTPRGGNQESPLKGHSEKVPKTRKSAELSPGKRRRWEELHDPSRRETPVSRPSNTDTRTRNIHDPDQDESPSLRRPRPSKSLGHLHNRAKAALPPLITTSGSSSPTKQSVKAMAAMFENQEPPLNVSPSWRKLEPRRQNNSPKKKSSPQAEYVRESKSGPVGVPSPRPKPPWLSDEDPNRPDVKETGVCHRHSKPERELRKSVSDNVLLRAPEEAVEETQSGRPKRMPLMRAPKSMSSLKTKRTMDGSSNKAVKAVPSLGTMLPHREQPAIAQHLVMNRPQPSPPNRPEEDGYPIPIYDPDTPSRRSSGTTVLHSQICNLQRQLDFRSEEAAQLKRQLDAQEEADTGTLSEQLREANRDLSMWKDRAETAERRIKVFEKFTAKLRGIRDSTAAAGKSEQNASIDEAMPEAGDAGEENSGRQNVRFAEGKQLIGRKATDGGESNDSGVTEDTGVVAARIRACLHGVRGNDGALDSPAMMMFDGVQGDGKSDTTKGETKVEMKEEKVLEDSPVPAVAVEMWVAVEELLRVQDEGMP